MKRATVYLIAISVLLSAFLTGCGENRLNRQTNTTDVPQTTTVPEKNLPEESDGIVSDTDGVITDDDNVGADNSISGETTSDVKNSDSTTVGKNSMENDAKTTVQ